MSISITDLSFSYAGKNDFGLAIPKLALNTGETHVLLGPSGSGKTTLLNLLAGTLRPTNGSLTIAGQDLSGITNAKMDRFRGDHIGFVFQTLNLVPWLSARDNIALGLAFAPLRRARLRASVNDAIDDLVAQMHIAEPLMSKPAGALSIGQQQRVAAARALIGAPDIILADEPSSALDEQNTKLFFDLLMGNLDRTRQTLLVVSHDMRVTGYFDHVLSVDNVLQREGDHE